MRGIWRAACSQGIATAVIALSGEPPSLALTMLSCSVNLPSVPSGQRDVITTCSWQQEEVSSEVPLLLAL